VCLVMCVLACVSRHVCLGMCVSSCVSWHVCLVMCGLGATRLITAHNTADNTADNAHEHTSTLRRRLNSESPLRGCPTRASPPPHTHLYSHMLTYSDIYNTGACSHIVTYAILVRCSPHTKIDVDVEPYSRNGVYTPCVSTDM